VARVRIALARATEYKVRSTRNTIRVELDGVAAAATVTAPAPAVAPPGAADVPTAALTPVSSAPPAPKRGSARPRVSAPEPAADPATLPPAATTIERVRTSRKSGSTLVTITGNGRLTPTGVTESRDLPRRVILDFPNVASNVAPQLQGDGTLVRRVRVGLNNNTPLVTRVVMEIADGAT
jgi:hypothetical protein